MKQHEQVIKVMQENGGYATLGYLNQHVDVSKWKTKTPFASIRRIVQDKRFYFKIKPGLWALNNYKEIVLKKFNLKYKDKEETNIFNHTYFQGLITEIGNFENFQTYIPNQDKNRLFLEKPLKEISTIQEIYDFTYEDVLRRAKTVDVIWFNERNFPNSFFEIETGEHFLNSLDKFYHLQDFYSEFFIVSPAELKRSFDQVMNRNIYKSINKRVIFRDYEYISNLHSSTFEYYKFKSKKNL